MKLTSVPDPSSDPSLLDVVPWSFGFAHAWALASLLEHHPAASDRLMPLLDPDGHGPWTIDRVEREHVLPGARPDVAVVARDADGKEVRVAVEIKGSDNFDEAQLERYRAHGFDAAVYAPGLSGLFFAPSCTPEVARRWITGADFVEALTGLQLPPLLEGYVRDVAHEAARISDARLAVRTNTAWEVPGGRIPEADLEAAAWLVEITEELRRRGEDDLNMRLTPRDRGMYWGGQAVGMGNGTHLFLDVLASHGGWKYVVAVKVGGGDEAARAATYEHLRSAVPSEDWVPGRRGKGGTRTVWRFDANDSPVAEAVEQVLFAARHAQQFAGRLG